MRKGENWQQKEMKSKQWMHILLGHKCHRLCHMAQVDPGVCVCVWFGGCILLTEPMSDILEFCNKMMSSSTLTLKVTDVLWLNYCIGETKIDPLHLK